MPESLVSPENEKIEYTTKKERKRNRFINKQNLQTNATKVKPKKLISKQLKKKIIAVQMFFKFAKNFFPIMCLFYVIETDI